MSSQSSLPPSQSLTGKSSNHKDEKYTAATTTANEILKDQNLQARHIDGQRLELVKYCLALLAGLITAAITFRIPLLTFIFGLGLIFLANYGKRLTKQYRHQFKNATERAKYAVAWLDVHVMNKAISRANKAIAKEENKERAKIKKYWVWPYHFIMAAGILMLLAAIFTVGARLTRLDISKLGRVLLAGSTESKETTNANQLIISSPLIGPALDKQGRCPDVGAINKSSTLKRRVLRCKRRRTRVETRGIRINLSVSTH